ncbi:MAG: O-antigen ligase family protein [Clostridia bacterium]|nr:O-antigen ligase family protein [Clostridia bacterium]
MKTTEKRLILFLEWFVLLQPVLDFLTSLTVRFVDTPLTVGMICRILFLGLAGVWLFFFYDGAQKKLLCGAFLVTALYGVLSVGMNAAAYGFGTVVENGKMFFKMFYFVFVLLFFYALYKKYGFEVKNKLLCVVFLEYTASIFVSALTGTSFVTYEYAKGYCGWFYAGNEVGAIVSVLAAFALLYAAGTKQWWIKLSVGFLTAFAACYIGTKVPFLACLGAVAVLLVFFGVKACLKKTRADAGLFLQLLAVLCAVLILFRLGSPVKVNGDALTGYHYDTNVSDKLEDDEEDTDPDDVLEESGAEWNEDGLGYKIFLVANWLLSNRLVMIAPAFLGYINAPLSQILFGMGYTFRLPDGELFDYLIEMDFLALVINHGIVGTLIFLAPILYFAVICLKRLFRLWKRFFELQEAVASIYSILIALGCAFLAGHVLVAPAVSIYLAIAIVKLYATLEQKLAEKKETASASDEVKSEA